MKGEYPMRNSLEIKESEMKTGRIYLGTVKVELGKMFIFGAEQRLAEMVSFVPGLGNGSYEVHGEIAHIPNQGYRIVKVDVEFLSPEEILLLEKEHSDHVLEVTI